MNFKNKDLQILWDRFDLTKMQRIIIEENFDISLAYVLDNEKPKDILVQEYLYIASLLLKEYRNYK